MLQWGERHFLKLSVCLSFRPLIHNRVLWKEIYQVRGFGFGAQFFLERSKFDSLVEREKGRERQSLREREFFF